jgi:hypothetical protein
MLLLLSKQVLTQLKLGEEQPEPAVEGVEELDLFADLGQCSAVDIVAVQDAEVEAVAYSGSWLALEKSRYWVYSQ